MTDDYPPEDSFDDPTEAPSALEQIRLLRTQFQIALVALLVISGSVSVFFLKQIKSIDRQIDVGNRTVARYVESTEPVLNDFINDLREFRKKYPDFSPILEQWNISSPSEPPAPGEDR